MNTMEILTDPNFGNLPGIHHAFFTRNGGVSVGCFASLNCAVPFKKDGDNFANVQENRRRAMEYLGRDSESLITLFDVHGNNVIIVDKPWPIDNPPEADGMVTTKTNITLGQLSADCPLVLFADPIARVIGSAHAGWQGAYKGIIEETIKKMIAVGANIQHIHAIIGPSIFQESYEVGPEFVDRFIQQQSANQKYFKPSIKTGKTGHTLFDLRGYIKDKLLSLNIKSIAEIALDTYKEESRFFSFRRSIHRQERQFGNQLACIFLAEARNY